MAATVGYMVTWRCYGTWDGAECAESDSVQLSGSAKKPVEDAIMEEGKRAGEKIAAIAVWSNHVHAVVRYTGRDLGEFVGRSKAAGRKALRQMGFEGKVWARGYDKRFCFDEESLKYRIDYVERHGE